MQIIQRSVIKSTAHNEQLNLTIFCLCPSDRTFIPRRRSYLVQCCAARCCLAKLFTTPTPTLSMTDHVTRSSPGRRTGGCWANIRISLSIGELRDGRLELLFFYYHRESNFCLVPPPPPLLVVFLLPLKLFRCRKLSSLSRGSLSVQ